MKAISEGARRTGGWLAWGVVVWVAACGGSSDEATGTTGPSTAGSGGSSAGSSGSPTAGKAGSATAGTGGSTTAGSSGSTTAGSGGASAGSSGSTTAGSGGSTAGAAGSPAGAGGSTAGAAGSPAGAGGTAAGAAGAPAGAGGSTAGAAGMSAGAGGSIAGAGGSAGSAGSPHAVAECAKDEDCALQADCCACAGVPQPGSMCLLGCALDRCAPLKLTAKCAAGRCVTSASCDKKQVLCKVSEPVCPKGQTPTVDPATSCWGPCIAVEECESVPTCQTCLDAGQLCVEYTSKIKQPPHCQPLPKPCTKATCDCVGPAICDTVFSSCSENGDTLTCGCPTC